MYSKRKSIGFIIVTVLASMILLNVLAGLLINHAKQLELDQRFISWPWLMEHYGIGSVSPDVSYLVNNTIFSQFDNQLFADAMPIRHIERPLIGGIQLEDLIVLATDDALLLLTPEGEFVERMGAEAGVPAPIQNIGLYHGEPVLQTRQGMWRSNFMLDVWEPISLSGVSWSVPHPLSVSVENELKRFFYGKGISYQQLLLDIHNGHIAGQMGIWLIDILSLFIVVLSLSGLWMWWRRLT
ncbi:hypothetical protein LCGC14_0662690 [marine sediment metagenome]|uniref:PepSY domain-containing protein n=2 Tax=root TaxID=1 RepID=A0A0F9U1F7_9ZZZZ|nr:PepSY domain-containing protein [Methylophaga sp.]